MNMRDDTIALLKNPYRFISSKCRDLGCDVFETRVFLQRTYCMTGHEAAELFYNPKYFCRKGASPEAMRATLFGKGGLQGMDGAAHAHRKAMFLSLMTEENATVLKSSFHEKLQNSLKRWSLKEEVVLYDEFQKILTETVCDWAGIPMTVEERTRRIKEIVSLFDSTRSLSPGHLMARLSRKNAEDWIENIVMDLRSDGYEPLIKTPIETIIWHRDEREELLKTHTAAIEILNLIRPTVAISVYLVFLAHALHSNPDCHEKLISTQWDQSNENKYALDFINEVRRYYPFFPSIIAKVRDDFRWKNIQFKKGARAILDLYGINNDPRLWDSPQFFWPERFEPGSMTEYNFMPQGGGPRMGHRCPGEFFTVELMKTALNFFVFEMDYDVPAQNMDIDWKRLPAIPESGFVISKVEPKTMTIQTSITEITEIEETRFF